MATTKIGNAGVTFPDNTVQNSAANSVIYPVKFMSVNDQNTAFRHAFVILNDNSIRGWGDPGAWRLGTGDANYRVFAESPAFPPYFPGATAVHTSNEVLGAVIDLNGQLWTWGTNDYGQNGRGDTADTTVPYNASLNVNNSIYGRTVTKIALPCGAEDVGFIMVLCSDGTVHACGYNGYGQCGNGNTTNQYYFVRCGTLTNVVDISCGRENYTSCTAVTSSGQLYVWGYNGDWQLGTNNGSHQSTPLLRDTGSLTGKTITKAQAGFLTIVALASDGTLHGAGNQTTGSFGIGNTSRQNVFTQIASGVADFSNNNYDYPVTIIRKTNNTMQWAGGNGTGDQALSTSYVVSTDEYGVPTYGYTNGTVWQPINIPTTINGAAVTPVKWVKGGTGNYNYILILMSNGYVYGCGYGGNGALANGYSSNVPASSPTLCLIPPCTDIACWGHGAEGTTGFITTTRKLYCSGYGGGYSNANVRGETVWSPIVVQLY